MKPRVVLLPPPPFPRPRGSRRGGATRAGGRPSVCGISKQVNKIIASRMGTCDKIHAFGPLKNIKNTNKKLKVSLALQTTKFFMKPELNASSIQNIYIFIGLETPKNNDKFVT